MRRRHDSAASWSDGDWDGDGRVLTSDLVAAFQSGTFQQSVEAAFQPDGPYPWDDFIATDAVVNPFYLVSARKALLPAGMTDIDFARRIAASESESDANSEGDSEPIFSNEAGSTVEDQDGQLAVETGDDETGDDETGDDETGDIETGGDETGGDETDGEVIDEDENSGGLIFDEQEPAGSVGLNDGFEAAEPLSGLGTGPSELSSGFVNGTLFPAPTILEPQEDDGDISKANETELTSQSVAITRGTIGDGPFGKENGGTGDFDFYAIRGMKKGQILNVNVDTPESSELDSFLLVWDSTGELVDANDNELVSFDSLLNFRPPEDGDYFVSIAGFGSFWTGRPVRFFVWIRSR